MPFLVERCGEMVLSDENSHDNPVPPPFVTKTYELVDDPRTDQIVSWGDDGTSLVIWRPIEFARDLLPNYFKHNNFSSFVRRLNYYDFRKLKARRWEFANEFFVKGAKHLLVEIRRKKPAPPLTAPLPPNLSYRHHHVHLDPFPAPTQAMYNNFVHAGVGNNNEVSGAVGGYDNAVGSAAVACMAALSDTNRQLRRRNSQLRSELSHVKNLYNDIAYFAQSHVAPVTSSPSATVHASQASDGGVASSCRLMLDPVQTPSPPPRRSVIENGVKLFGVILHGKKKKRAHEDRGDDNHGQRSKAG